MKKKQRKITTYSEAGVNIERGDNFVKYIKGLNSGSVSRHIGGFSGGIELSPDKYKNPVLLSTTDGVGTKLLIARSLKTYDTIGIDLVAMCVNDLIVCGVEPLSFLDYIAFGTLKEGVLEDIMKGIVQGCEEAGCILTGGETAEMPDLYSKNDFDLAGFCTGIGERDSLLPKKESISPGDPIFGLPSVGVHSNGLSLARKIIPEKEDKLFRQLLLPTKIYVRDMKTILDSNTVLAAAHITGGGLEGNIKRVLPDSMKASLNYSWEIPEIFMEIQNRGVSSIEMRKVFNMGIGIAIVVGKSEKDAFTSFCKSHMIHTLKIGEVVDG